MVSHSWSGEIEAVKTAWTAAPSAEEQSDNLSMIKMTLPCWHRRAPVTHHRFYYIQGYKVWQSQYLLGEAKWHWVRKDTRATQPYQSWIFKRIIQYLESFFFPTDGFQPLLKWHNVIKLVLLGLFPLFSGKKQSILCVIWTLPIWCFVTGIRKPRSWLWKHCTTHSNCTYLS